MSQSKVLTTTHYIFVMLQYNQNQWWNHKDLQCWINSAGVYLYKFWKECLHLQVILNLTQFFAVRNVDSVTFYVLMFVYTQRWYGFSSSVKHYLYINFNKLNISYWRICCLFYSAPVYFFCCTLQTVLCCTFLLCCVLLCSVVFGTT